MQYPTVKILGAFVLGVLVAGGISFAVAAPPAGAGLAQNLAPARDMFAQRFRRGWQDGMRGPVAATIADLRGLQRLYLLQGQRQKIPDLYRYVLGKTQNPVLRNYVYQRLARSELQVTNADQAVATLRQNLDENLTQLNQAGGSKP